MNTVPDFIAIDFETATHDMDSACSVGIAIVKDGLVADSFYSLIQPPGNRYDPHNSRIHGITSEDTRNAPRFSTVWRDIQYLFGTCPVVAHNANFDMSVLANCCKYSSVAAQNFKYLDTMSMVKGIVDGGKSLSNCADFFGISLENHHNALDDAKACAEIALACLKHAGEHNIASFAFKTPHVLIRNFSELLPMETFHSSHHSHEKSSHKKRFHSISPKDICPCTDSFDKCHPLYGKNIVFTGELSVDRRTAMQMAADVGAVCKSSVSGKTDYLIVGAQDITVVGEDGMSSKEERAYALNSAGKANITILQERDFLALFESTQHFSSHDKRVDGVVFTLTGYMNYSGDELCALIEQHGGQASCAICGQTAYVVAGEEAEPDILNKAHETEIPVINEEDLLRMLGMEMELYFV